MSGNWMDDSSADFWETLEQPAGCIAGVVSFPLFLFCSAFFGNSFLGWLLGLIAGGIAFWLLYSLISAGKFMDAPVKASNGHGRFCTQCGQPSRRGAKFCTQCGDKLRPK